MHDHAPRSDEPCAVYPVEHAVHDELPPHPTEAAEMGLAALIEDAEERAAALTRHLALAQAWVEWGSRRRDVAVLQMRAKGASYDDVARVLKISKSRAQQLCRRLARQQEEQGSTPPTA